MRAMLLLAVAGGAMVAADAAGIAKLIDQLGNDDAGQRQAAVKKLEEIGAPALEPVQKAAKEHPDADVRLRAALVAKTLQRTVLGGELRTIKGHNGWVFRIILTPDGKQAISCGDAIRVWDLDKGQELRHSAPARAAGA